MIRSLLTFLVALVVITPAVNAQGVGIGVSIQTVFADTLEPVGFDPQFDGTELRYAVSVFQPLPTGASILGGDLTVTLPNGIQEQLASPLPMIMYLAPATYLSGIYVVDSDDAVGDGSLVAWADVGETVRVVQDCPTALGASVSDCQLAATASIPVNTLVLNAECLADFDHSGAVDAQDLVMFIMAWGTVAPWADVEPTPGGGFTGVPDVYDLCRVVYQWGTCD